MCFSDLLVAYVGCALCAGGGETLCARTRSADAEERQYSWFVLAQLVECEVDDSVPSAPSDPLPAESRDEADDRNRPTKRVRVNRGHCATALRTEVVRHITDLL